MDLVLSCWTQHIFCFQKLLIQRSKTEEEEMDDRFILLITSVLDIVRLGWGTHLTQCPAPILKTLLSAGLRGSPNLSCVAQLTRPSVRSCRWPCGRFLGPFSRRAGLRVQEVGHIASIYDLTAKIFATSEQKWAPIFEQGKTLFHCSILRHLSTRASSHKSTWTSEWCVWKARKVLWRRNENTV